MSFRGSAVNNVLEYSIPGRRAEAYARRWIGTPFLHQGRALGVGIDCVGLILQVNKHLGGTYDRANYGREPLDCELEKGFDRLFRRVWSGPPGPPFFFLGEILLIQYGKRQHCGIASTVGIIHAYQTGGARPGWSGGAVVETPIDDKMRRRIKGVYRWPV